ncbi:uncharacterized protein ACR2FA_010963 [Aphomia sociella]
MSEILNLSSICRCCHSDGVFKNLNTRYIVENQVEIYSVMLSETMGLSISMPNMEVSKSICEECIIKLRDVSKFKKQVVTCEKKFEEYCKNEEALNQNVENIKTEWDSIDDDLHNDDEVSQDCKDVVFQNYKDDNICKIEVEIEQQDNKNQYKSDDRNVALKAEPEICTPRKEPKKKKITKDRKLKKSSVKDEPPSATHAGKEDGEVYHCQLCEISYNSKKSLKMHVALKHKSFICEICDSKFKSKPLLKKHMATEHNDFKPYECRYCLKTFRAETSLADHVNTHTNLNTYQCDICEKMFRYKQTLRKHLKWHSGEIQKVICEVCGGSFNDQSNLKSHLQTVHQKLRLYKCHLCPKAFAANKTLKVHMRNHTGERPYPCDLCTKSFTSFSSRKAHMEKHDPEFSYQCKVCPQTFKTRGEFTKHTKKHVGMKPLVCDTCGKDFTCGYSLKRHMVEHTGLKPFECDKCDKKFSQKAVMVRHMKRLHNGTRRSPADRKQCGLCKRLVYNMEKHLETHNNRPHVCEYCNKNYSERNTLNRHILTVHLGRRAFPCQFCDKKYKQRSALKHHNLKVHKMPVKTEIEENLDSTVTKYTIVNKYRKKKICPNNLTLELADQPDEALG